MTTGHQQHVLPSYLNPDDLGPWGVYLQQIDRVTPHLGSLSRWVETLKRPKRILTVDVPIERDDGTISHYEGYRGYHHPRQPVQLDPSRYDMLVLGRESLRAYARCDRNRVPEFVLPGTKKAPLPFLSYTNNAYLGRMVELILGDAKPPLHLEPHYETDMAEGLKMMALEGRGIAFLPESAVTRELKQKLLARADNDSADWEIEMDIRLYRERPSAQRPGKAIVGRLWQFLEQRQEEKTPRRRVPASER